MSATSSPRLRKIKTPPASQEIRKLLKDHKEIIVITANPDQQDTGEANLAVYSKLADKKGVLAAYLEQVLANLLRIRHGKQAHRTSKTASIGA